MRTWMHLLILPAIKSLFVISYAAAEDQAELPPLPYWILLVYNKDCTGCPPHGSQPGIVPYKGFYPSNALPYFPGERDKELANFRNQTEELKAHYLQQVAVLHSHEDPNSSDENLDGHGKGKGKGKGKGSKRKTSLGYLNSIYDYLDSADVSYESSGIDDSESGDSSSKNYAHHSYHSDNSIEEYDTEDHYGGYHNENYKYDDSRAKDTKPGSLAIGSINTQNSGTEGAYALPNYGEEGGMDESKNSEIESHIHPGDIYVGFSNRRISLTNKQKKEAIKLLKLDEEKYNEVDLIKRTTIITVKEAE